MTPEQVTARIREIASISSDVDRHRAVKALAKATDSPTAAVRADVERIRVTIPVVERTDWRGELIFRQDGVTLKPCVQNASILLQHDERWAGRLRFNLVTLNIECGDDTPIDADAGTWTDVHTIMTTMWLQRHSRLDVHGSIVFDAAIAAAQARPYNPIRDYLNGLAWDGIERLDTWLEDLAGVERTEYSQRVGRCWLISAVARAFRPGCQADHVLVLEGRQGLGKSRLLRVLAGQWFGDELGQMGSKDAGLQLRGRWIIEIAELDSIRKSETSATKAFLSRSVDFFRPPYGRVAQEWPRSCVFAGSTNEPQYLVDATGGRRYWPVKCHEIDLVSAVACRDQLWAEAKARFDAEETWWLTGDETVIAEVEQTGRLHEDAWFDRIRTMIGEWGQGPITTAAILKMLDIPTMHQNRAASMRVADMLRLLDMRRTRNMTDGIRSWRWVRGAE